MPTRGPDVRPGPTPEVGAQAPKKFRLPRGGGVQGREIVSREAERARAKGRDKLATGEQDISKRMDEIRDTWQRREMEEVRHETTGDVKSQLESPTVTTVSRRKGRLQSATQLSGAYHELPKLFDHFGIRGPDALDQIARMPAEQQIRVAKDLRPLLEQVYTLRGGDGRAEFELLSPQEILQESYDFAGTVARELIAREYVLRSSEEIDIDHDKRERVKASEDQLDEKVGRWGFIRRVKDSFHARTKTRRELGRMKNLLQLKGGSAEWERLKAAHNKRFERDELPEVDKNFQKKREHQLMLQAIAAEEIGSTDFSSEEFKKILTDRGVPQESFQRFLSGEDSEELYKDMGKAFTERTIDRYRKNRTIQDLAETDQQLLEARRQLANVSRSNDMREISGAFNNMRKLERKRKYYARGWDVKNKINIAEYKVKEAKQTDQGEIRAKILGLRTTLWGKIVEAKAGGIALNLKDWIIDIAHQADSVGYEVTKGVKGRVVQAANSVGDRAIRRWEMHDEDSTIYKNLERPKYVATRFNVLARETRSNEEMSDRVGSHRTKAKELVEQIIRADADAAAGRTVAMPAPGERTIEPTPQQGFRPPAETRPGGGGPAGGGGETGGTARRDTATTPVVPTTPESRTPGTTPAVEPASETGTRVGAAAEVAAETRVNTQEAIKLSLKALDEEVKKLREEAFKQLDPDGKPNASLMFQADQAQLARRMLQAETDGNPFDAFTPQQRDLYIAGGQVQLPIFEMMNATEYGPVINRVPQPLSREEQVRIRPLLEQQAREFLSRTSRRADRATVDQIVNDSLYQFSFMDRGRMVRFFQRHEQLTKGVDITTTGETRTSAELAGEYRDQVLSTLVTEMPRVLTKLQADLAATPAGPAKDRLQYQVNTLQKALTQLYDNRGRAGVSLEDALKFNTNVLDASNREIILGVPITPEMTSILEAEIIGLLSGAKNWTTDVITGPDIVALRGAGLTGVQETALNGYLMAHSWDKYLRNHAMRTTLHVNPTVEAQITKLLLGRRDWETVLKEPETMLNLGLTEDQLKRVDELRKGIAIFRNGARDIRSSVTPPQYQKLLDAERDRLMALRHPGVTNIDRVTAADRTRLLADVAANVESTLVLDPARVAQEYAKVAQEGKGYDAMRDAWLESLAPEGGVVTARVAARRENDMENAAAQAARREVNGKIKHGYELMLEELRVQAHINPDGSAAAGHTAGSPEETRFLTAQAAFEDAQRTGTDLIAAELPIYDEALTALDTKLALLRDNPGGAGVRQLQEIQRIRKVTGIDTLSMAAITGIDPPDENMKKQTREVLKRQTGLDDASVDRLLASLTVAAGVDVNGVNDEMEHMLPKEARALFLKLRESGRTESLNAFADQAADILTRRTPTDVELRGLAELVNGNQAVLNQLASQIVALDHDAARNFLTERATQPRGNADVRILLELAQTNPDTRVSLILNRLTSHPEKVNEVLGELLQLEPVGRDFVRTLYEANPHIQNVISRKYVAELAVEKPVAAGRIVELLVRTNRAKAIRMFDDLTAANPDIADRLFVALGRNNLAVLTSIVSKDFATAQAMLRFQGITGITQPIASTPDRFARILMKGAQVDPDILRRFIAGYRTRLLAAATPPVGTPPTAAHTTAQTALDAMNADIHSFIKAEDSSLIRFHTEQADGRGLNRTGTEFDAKRDRLKDMLASTVIPAAYHGERDDLVRDLMIHDADTVRRIINEAPHAAGDPVTTALQTFTAGEKARQKLVSYARKPDKDTGARVFENADMAGLIPDTAAGLAPLTDAIATIMSAYPEEAARLLGTLAQTAGGRDPAREIFRALMVNPADANDMSKLDKVAEVFASMEPNVYRMLIRRVTAMEPDLLNKALAEDIISDQIRGKDAEISDLDGTLKFVRGVTGPKAVGAARIDRIRAEVERIEKGIGPAKNAEQFKKIRELAEKNVDAAIGTGNKVISADKALREVDRQQQAGERHVPEAVKSVNDTTLEFQDRFVRDWQESDWNPIQKQELGMQVDVLSAFIVDRGANRMTIQAEVPKSDRRVDIGTPIFVDVDPTGRYVGRENDRKLVEMTDAWDDLSRDKQEALIAYAIQATQPHLSSKEQTKLLEDTVPELRNMRRPPVRGSDRERREWRERKDMLIEQATRRIVVGRVLSQARFINPDKATSVYSKEKEQKDRKDSEAAN